MKDQIMELTNSIFNDDSDKGSIVKDLRKFNDEHTQIVVKSILGSLNDFLIDDSEDGQIDIDQVIKRLDYMAKAENWKPEIEDHDKVEDSIEVLESCYKEIDDTLDEIYQVVENGDDELKEYINDCTKYAYDLERYGSQEDKDDFIERMASADAENLDKLPTQAR